jgi:hypothetical protein
MARQIMTTPNAPSSALFSQGVRAGSQVFVSGTTGIAPGTGGRLRRHERGIHPLVPDRPRARYAANLGAEIPGPPVSIRMTAAVT